MFNNFTEMELKNERWRDIEGYEGMYQVSDLGRVRSKKYGYWRVMRPANNGKGYLIVHLKRDGSQKNFLVHRLVASAFIPNTDSSKTIINHINSIRDCNRVENLEWCDYQYNNTYNDIHHRRIVNRISSKYKRDKIRNLYNPELSTKQNLEIFKANGIDCSRYTVIRLRIDLGLIK